MNRQAAILLALAATCLPAFAITDALDSGLRKCAGEIDQARRLACFDALAASLPKVAADTLGMTADIDRKRKAATQKALGVQKHDNAIPEGPTSESAGQHTATAPARVNSAAAGAAATVTAKIVSLREDGRGALIFSLDNDQVWIQDQPSRTLRFRAGEVVRIEHGALTSLWLAADHGRKTRVRRLS